MYIDKNRKSRWRVKKVEISQNDMHGHESGFQDESSVIDNF